MFFCGKLCWCVWESVFVVGIWHVHESVSERLLFLFLKPPKTKKGVEEDKNTHSLTAWEHVEPISCKPPQNNPNQLKPKKRNLGLTTGYGCAGLVSVCSCVCVDVVCVYFGEGRKEGKREH